MQIRFPWIISRKRLLVAAFLDGIIFLATYCGYFYVRFERAPLVSTRLILLLILWTLSSYVFGRYINGREYKYQRLGLEIIQLFLRTLVVLSITLGITLLHSWLFNNELAEVTFRSFLIPFLGLLAFISPFCQFLLSRWIQKNTASTQHWILLGQQESYTTLLRHLQFIRLPVKIAYMQEEELTSEFEGNLIFDDNIFKSQRSIHLLLTLQQKGVQILNRLSWCESVLQRFPPDLLSDEDLLRGEFTKSPLSAEFRLKRVGDIFVSLLILIVSCPILLLVAFLIKIQDGGPIFYSQVRAGLNGKHFRIWKFRSMRVDAETDGIQWSDQKDNRITRIGNLIRRLRIDELPQLFCVINGSMSLIGPRPERPEIDIELMAQIPHYQLRYKMLPGLSGWAQVNYPYGASLADSENKLSYDLFYLRNYSFFLDLLIFFKTIRLVFNAQGAIANDHSSLL